MPTLDTTTEPIAVASVPGNLVISRWKYARYFSHGPRRWIDYYLSTFLPKWMGWLGAGMKHRVMHWTRMREQCHFGCLCPSLVLDQRSSLVATYTNLYAGREGAAPVIKVHWQPLKMLPRKKRANGSRLACVSAYYRDEGSWRQDYWDDFYPLPIDCLVASRAARENAQNRLSAAAWKALEMGVSQLHPIRREGLFPISIPREMVWEAARDEAFS